MKAWFYMNKLEHKLEEAYRYMESHMDEENTPELFKNLIGGESFE